MATILAALGALASNFTQKYTTTTNGGVIDTSATAPALSNLSAFASAFFGKNVHSEVNGQPSMSVVIGDENNTAIRAVKIPVAMAGTLSASTTQAHNIATLSLFDISGNLVAFDSGDLNANSVNGGATISTNVAAGTYTLIVDGWGNGTTSSLDLVINGLAHSQGGHEVFSPKTIDGLPESLAYLATLITQEVIDRDEKIKALIGGATPEALNTLKKIDDYIAVTPNATVMEAINSALQDATGSVSALSDVVTAEKNYLDYETNLATRVIEEKNSFTQGSTFSNAGLGLQHNPTLVLDYGHCMVYDPNTNLRLRLPIIVGEGVFVDFTGYLDAFPDITTLQVHIQYHYALNFDTERAAFAAI